MRLPLPHHHRCFRAAVIALSVMASAPRESPAAVLDYAGTWVNQTFNETGAAAARIDTDVQSNVTFTLDLQGDAFGGPFGFPPVTPLTLNGMLNPDQSVTFDPVFGHATYGYVIASFDSGGGVLIDCDPMPVNPNLTARMQITGQRSLESIDLQFLMQTYTGIPFGSTGSIGLSLIPEPSAVALPGLALLATRLRLRRTRSITSP